MEFKQTEVWGFKHALRGMRNSMDSWDKSDSGICKGGDNGIGCESCSFYKRCNHDYDGGFKIGKKDLELAQTLLFKGDNPQFMRMIHVVTDVDTTIWDTNYAEIRNMYFQRRNEERCDTFYAWVKTLPYAEELIMYEGV